MTDTKPIAPFAAGPVWSIAGVVAMAQLAAAIVGYAYWFDEVYMVAIGRHHLDWGSADQPPLTPALIDPTPTSGGRDTGCRQNCNTFQFGV